MKFNWTTKTDNGIVELSHNHPWMTEVTVHPFGDTWVARADGLKCDSLIETADSLTNAVQALGKGVSDFDDIITEIMQYIKDNDMDDDPMPTPHRHLYSRILRLYRALIQLRWG